MARVAFIAHWGVREQFDTPLYRRHCRRIAKLVATVMEGHAAAGDDVVMIGVDSSPTMGVDFTPHPDEERRRLEALLDGRHPE